MNERKTLAYISAPNVSKNAAEKIWKTKNGVQNKRLEFQFANSILLLFYVPFWQWVMLLKKAIKIWAWES